jgi:hypothetical protein
VLGQLVTAGLAVELVLGGVDAIGLGENLGGDPLVASVRAMARTARASRKLRPETFARATRGESCIVIDRGRALGPCLTACRLRRRVGWRRLHGSPDRASETRVKHEGSVVAMLV